MKNSSLCIVEPNKMNEKQIEDFTSLHQKYINLSKESIIEYFKNRDKLYLYYHKETKQLIATAGIQFLISNNCVFIYIGNTVVDEQFKHEGCLSHAIMKSLIYCYFRYPFKKKYWCALTSSSGSFSYAQKFQPCWPNRNEKTSTEITGIMEECIKKIGVSEYKIIDGNLITYDLSYKVKETFLTKPKNKNCVNASFFDQINPNSQKGEQLFFINECCIYKLINAGIYSLHHRLINKPKLYHSLKKKRLTHPFLSTLIFIRALMPNGIKCLGAIAAGSLVFFILEYLHL